MRQPKIRPRPISRCRAGERRWKSWSVDLGPLGGSALTTSRTGRLGPRFLRRVLVVGVAAAVALTVAVLPADAATVPPSATATLGNANPADNTPHVQSGEVRAFAQVGTKVYVGGTFTNIKA